MSDPLPIAGFRRRWLLPILRPAVVPALLILLLFPAAVGAHELWLESVDDGAGWRLHWGHVAGSDHEGVRSLPYERSAVVQAICRDPGGDSRDLAPVVAEGGGEGPVDLPACGGLLAVRLDAGTWTRTPRGTRPGGPDTNPGGLESWRAWASVKRLVEWAPGSPRPVLDGLELTPVEDPSALSPGDKIDLLVTLDGAPVADAVVRYEGRPRGSSDRDGRIRLRLREAGAQHLSATLEREHPEGPLDRTLYEAYLVFELSGAEEGR